jgi:hypothetical protein
MSLRSQCSLCSLDRILIIWTRGAVSTLSTLSPSGERGLPLIPSYFHDIAQGSQEFAASRMGPEVCSPGPSHLYRFQQQRLHKVRLG